MKDKGFFGIPGSTDWLGAEPVLKGWSSDRKYLVRTASDEKLLLRLSDADRFDEKKKEFAVVSLYAGTGICMSRPLDFGLCEEGRSVYMLLAWLEGRDLEEVLPCLPVDEQFRLGAEAGSIRSGGCS